MGDQEKLKQAENFFEKRILGWMINDLNESIKAETKFLTALGCFVYTEVIGIFLPKVDDEYGSEEQKRFYRCFFRLLSKNYLKNLDTAIKRETNKGLYAHLRHNMAHKYVPSISKRQGNVVLFIPSMVARNGILPNGKPGGPPIFVDKKGQIVIATRNYTNELEKAYHEFYKKIFTDKDEKWVESAENGIDIIRRGKIK